MPSPSLLFPFKTTNQLGKSFSFDQTKSNQDGATVSPETESVNSGSAEIPVFSASLVLPVKTRRVSAKKSRKGGKNSSKKTLVLRTQDGTVVEKPKRKFLQKSALKRVVILDWFFDSHLIHHRAPNGIQLLLLSLPPADTGKVAWTCWPQQAS